MRNGLEGGLRIDSWLVLYIYRAGNKAEGVSEKPIILDRCIIKSRSISIPYSLYPVCCSTDPGKLLP